LSSAGYLKSKSKGYIADIRKYRKVIADNDYIYKNNPGTEKGNKDAAEALFQIANAYETLELHNKAIEYYLKLVKEFPKFDKASRALFQVGNIYFYKLYDYKSGWPYYVKVIKEYPKSYEAGEADRLLKETKATLDNISEYMAHVHKYTSKKALDYEEHGRYVTQADKYSVFADQIAQDYTNIAKSWLDLKNYPYAIATYKELAKELSMKKFESAEARYQVGKLYQDNGQYQEAIKAYDELFDKSPGSTRRSLATYNQAICYQAIGNFEKAYEGFKTYLGFSKDEVDQDLYREAKQRVRQMEMDQDGDGYKFYQEQEAGTSDQDPNSHP